MWANADRRSATTSPMTWASLKAGTMIQTLSVLIAVSMPTN
jgi:hypothetical protein